MASLGNRDYVRRLMGVKDVSKISDSDIDKALTEGTSEVIGNTLKTDWDTDITHPLYPKAVLCAEYYASSICLDRYARDAEKATRHLERANMKCQELKTQLDEYDLANQTGGSGSTQKFSVVVSKYKSWPKNPNADIPQSPTVISSGI